MAHIWVKLKKKKKKRKEIVKLANMTINLIRLVSIVILWNTRVVFYDQTVQVFVLIGRWKGLRQ